MRRLGPGAITRSTTGSSTSSSIAPRAPSEPPCVWMRSSSWTHAADIEPRRKSGALFLLVFLHRFAGELERLDSRRHAAVHRHLKQDLADLLARAAVGGRALHVGLELVRAVQRGEHADVDQAAQL